MKKIFFALAVMLLASVQTMAQVVTGTQPRSFAQGSATIKKSLDSHDDIPVISLERPDISRTSRKGSKSGTLLFGKHIITDIDFVGESLKTHVSGGSIYRLMITSAGAYSLGFVFSGLSLSAGSELYLYSADAKDVLGAITSSNNKDDGELKTAQIDGDSVMVELFVPDGIEQPSFRITRVIYDFRNLNDVMNTLLKANRTSSHSGDCEIDINCELGLGYQNVKRSVVRYTFTGDGGEGICTGALINNYRNDGSPFLLTAAHCICTKEAAAKAVFYFNYEKAECEGDSIVAKKNTASGANLLATANTTTYGKGDFDIDCAPLADFTLLRLTDTIHDKYEPYYSGFSINTTDNIATVTTIHHPNGDYKKISVSSDTPYRDTWPDPDECKYTPNQHWHVAKWEKGTTEQGSSGAPLYNNKGQIIGILSGGYADCGSPRDDYFQMFSEAWLHDEKPEKQLMYWLAGTTGISEISGYDPLLSTPVVDEIIPANQQTMLLYPNPADDVIFIKSESDIKRPILLIADMQGKLVSTKKPSAIDAETPYELSTKNLKPGTYILIVMTGSGKISKKFQKM